MSESLRVRKRQRTRERIATAVNRFITEDTTNEMNSLITQFWADDSMTPEAAQAKFVELLKNSD